MADTITLTFDTPKASRIGGAGVLGVVMGSANLSSYSTSKVALTALTGMFVPSTGILRVTTSGVSSNKFIVQWEHSSQSFRAWICAGTAAVVGEATNGNNVGTFDFIAVGQMSG